MATKSTFANMMNMKSASKKVLDADDMAVEPNEGTPAEEKSDRDEQPHVRGVRSAKAGKSKSTYMKMLKK